MAIELSEASAAMVGMLVHESSNGDQWHIDKDPDTGAPVIKHTANFQSGGHVSYIQINNFLAIGDGPEQQAFRRLTGKSVATLLIAYDIHAATGEAYEGLVNAIQSLGLWWHHLETVWLVQSEKTLQELKDQLREHIGADDQLIIVDVSGCAAEWTGISDAGSYWLKDKMGPLSQLALNV